MTPEQFEKSTKPYCFMMSVDPNTGAVNYEYLEGWDWGNYFQSIKADFPERFHKFVRNKVAKDMYLHEAWGIK